MNTRESREYPIPLERLRKRFERWRRKKPPRSRIADSLWTAAIQAAQDYGLSRTAQALRVNYYALKKRWEKDLPANRLPKHRPAARFIELPPIASASKGRVTGSCECTLEWEDAGGSGKMRAHIPSIATGDLAILCRSLRP
jgi:hypothetical protein